MGELGNAAEELFDAADPAFGMLAINARCATPPARAARRPGHTGCMTAEPSGWRLGAMIRISEPQADSRMRPDSDVRGRSGIGAWRFTGDKCSAPSPCREGSLAVAQRYATRAPPSLPDPRRDHRRVADIVVLGYQNHRGSVVVERVRRGAAARSP